MNRHSELYDKLQTEDVEMVLIIARHIARYDLPVEQAFRRFGDDSCAKHYDRLLFEVSEVLPEFQRDCQIREGDNIIEGRIFRIRLPAEAPT